MTFSFIVNSSFFKELSTKSADLESKRFGCHADLHTVSRWRTRGESEDHTGKKVCKGSTLALKPRADVTRSPKQGYQWSHKKDLYPPKNLKKEEICYQPCVHELTEIIFTASEHT